MSATVERGLDLVLVEDLVVEMFSSVASAVQSVSTAFLDGDVAAAREIVAGDARVDDLLATLESIAEAGLISCGGLSEAERRLLVYVLRTAPELERSGDLIEHIALRIPQGLVTHLPVRARDLVASMASVAAAMWRDAAAGFVERDPTVGIALRIRDEELDDFQLDLIETLGDSGCTPAVAIEMGLIARFYERLGDHAVNVAYRVNNLRTPA